MGRFLRKIRVVALAIAALWLAGAMTLALMPAPRFSHAPFTPGTPQASGMPCQESAQVRCFRMRDGALLAARLTPGDSNMVVLFLHGVLSSSLEFDETARRLHEATGAAVLRLDLRGHGLSAGIPGDLAHIGQYEEDVADVVSTLRKERPGARIVLAGHSMGGGIACRYAGRHEVPGVDAYLLFAPHLGRRSPTTRTEAANSSPSQDELQMKLHVPRLIGLVMLNVVGVRGLNGLDTLYFNVVGRLHAYTFRALASMAPDDYRAVLGADAKPMLILVGQKDEAFRADAYPAAARFHKGASVLVIPGESHDSVTRCDAADAAIRKWIEGSASYDLSMTSHAHISRSILRIGRTPERTTAAADPTPRCAPAWSAGRVTRR